MQLEGLVHLVPKLSNKFSTSECIFLTNEVRSLNEPTKERLNPTTNSSIHNKINKFNEETSSKKKVTDNTTLTGTTKENNQQRVKLITLMWNN